MIKPEVIDQLTPYFNFLYLGPEEYFEKLREYLDKFMEVDYKLHNVKKINDEFLNSYYRAGDIFIVKNSIEDKYLDLALKNFLPIVAIDLQEEESEYIALFLNNESFERVSALLTLLQKNRKLRRGIIKYQIEKTKIEPRIKIQIEGSFDSSYSLAIVNREVARALNKIFPKQVALYSTDGYGDFKPNRNFLRKNPDIAEMYKLSEKAMHTFIVLRNPYPPRVYDMKGFINGMTSYGWEESEYPKEFLEDFNRYLDLLPVMSPYVKKVMIDNGIEIPVYTVGIGVDHILSIKSKKYPLKTRKKFKFLHISSCFPRKGIDVLLDAYTSEFTKDDDVVLIIKTFPNPHNKVEELVKYYQEKNKNYPEIEVINKDIPDEQIAYLYEISDCFVLPSRGEGFGMPAAEAMLYKKPVIATNYSGQTFFCKEDTAILVDYFFEKSKSHMNLPFSYWATPKKDDLAKKLRYVYENIDSEEIQTRVEKAYKIVKEKFTWDNVARKLLNAIEEVENKPVFERKKIKVGWVSSWNSKCGIAFYSEFILNSFSQDIEVVRIANKLPENEILDKNKEHNTYRIWNFWSPKDINKILNFIDKENIDLLFIQHHFAFFEPKSFGRLIREVKEKNIPVFITFHSTDPRDDKLSLKNIAEDLKLADRIFVHSIKDVNKMKDIGTVDNVTLIPQGVLIRESNKEIVKKLKETYNLKGKKVIGTFGFLRKHKGILELIKAYSNLKEKIPNLSLLLLTSIYPSKDSQDFYEECINFINSLPLDKKKDIILITEYIPEEEIANYIDLMDIVVYPYHNVPESSSSAVRYALSLKKPIVVTPAEIFEDISDIAFITKGYGPEDIADTLQEILLNEEMLAEKKDKIEKFVETISWEKIALRLERIMKHFV